MLWPWLPVVTGYFYGIIHSINGVLVVLITDVFFVFKIPPTTWVQPHRDEFNWSTYGSNILTAAPGTKRSEKVRT